MADTPEYFQLRPEVEKAYGYTHAVKIGTNMAKFLEVSSYRNTIYTKHFPTGT